MNLTAHTIPYKLQPASLGLILIPLRENHMSIFFGIRWTLISGLVLIAGLIWIAFSRLEPGTSTNGMIPLPRQGFAAPEFSLETTEGNIVALSDLRGRPVLINIWTSWCPPCRAEMPALQRTYQTYHDQGFEILAINAANQDDLQDALTFAEEMGLTFPLLLDESGDVSNLYQLRSLPTSFFIDRQGIIREVVVGGPMSEALLRTRVEKLLEE